jgi:hypothetical protein
MLEPESREALKEQIATQIAEDGVLLEELRAEIRPLKDAVRRVTPRTTTSISLVAADGGNNQLRFDPFLIQLVRVVDSSDNELCLEVLSPTANVDRLSTRQFDSQGTPTTPLGHLMLRLGVSTLPQLTHMIRDDSDGRPKSPSWVQVYRELVEWATLYTIIATRDFATDTLIVFDGLLRSKVFAGDNFAKFRDLLRHAIEEQYRKRRRNIYLVGLAKHSKVLDRYRLAMALEGVMRVPYACYVEIPFDIERRAYVWQEYARGSADVEEGGEANKFVSGKMFFVKFGSGPRDPIWPVDIFEPQAGQASSIFGYLLADCVNGFPVPLYPRCLQKAHENAALVDFDMDILQDLIFDGLRGSLGDHAPSLDVFRLEDHDPAASRY